MLKGYTGKIAYVDLTTGKISYEPLDEDMARKYIGGAGLAAKILWDETTRQTEAISPENRLILMTGPLTGTMVPSSCRYILAGISPLTNIWGKASSGGSVADELRHAGFDGVVVKGQSSRPVYLWLHNQKAEIRDAGHIWGKDTYEVTDLIRKETHEKAGVACIGPAGERLVKFAGVINDGREGKAAARCGLGALMGAKKLKAIVARGTLPLSFYDEEKLRASVQAILRSDPPKKHPEMGSRESSVELLYSTGRVPLKNWSEGTFEPGKVYCKPIPVMDSKDWYCKHCPYGCSHNFVSEVGERYAPWEAWAPLGTNCLIANREAVQRAFSLCQRYGLDSISTGAVIAFAMECFEKGLITKNDTDGIELTWGNHEAMIEMVRKIGEREGFGELLGEGVRRAAERIGGIASEYAMHVKGLEVAAHNPRTTPTWALRYATGTIGAAHMEPQGAEELEGVGRRPFATCPELGYPVLLERFEEKGKGVLTAKTQNLGVLLDSLTICIFRRLGGEVMRPSLYLDLLNSVTGLDMPLDEFMLTGERIFNLIRMFSVRSGISRKDDILPLRFLTHKLTTGGTQGYIPHLGLMLNEYYSFRGWSEEGIPTRERLIKLGLEECLSEAVYEGVAGRK